MERLQSELALAADRMSLSTGHFKWPCFPGGRMAIFL